MSTLYQVSTLTALAQGNYYGALPVGKLLAQGDTGLGTFQDLNGEMIVLDGRCYRADEKGDVTQVADEELTPFATVTELKPYAKFPMEAKSDMDQALAYLNHRISMQGKNNIYVCRIDGKFSEVQARSEVAQQEPYRPLAKAMKTDQREFTFENVEGSLVCVYFPSYMGGLNLAGWHVHFISKDRNNGGHVFGFHLEEGEAQLTEIHDFRLFLPKNPYFQQQDFAVSKEEIESVEGKR